MWLQVSVAQLEQQLSDCEAALTEEKVVSHESKRQAEESQFQVDICFFSFLYFSYLSTDLMNKALWLTFFILLKKTYILMSANYALKENGNQMKARDLKAKKFFPNNLESFNPFVLIQ